MIIEKLFPGKKNEQSKFKSTQSLNSVSNNFQTVSRCFYIKFYARNRSKLQSFDFFFFFCHAITVWLNLSFNLYERTNWDWNFQSNLLDSPSYLAGPSSRQNCSIIIGSNAICDSLSAEKLKNAQNVLNMLNTKLPEIFKVPLFMK